MEKSFQEKAHLAFTAFSGAIALNVNVVAEIIGSIGNLEIPEYGFTLTKENFLDEIQREVRAGDDRKEGEPKRILKVGSHRENFLW